MCTPEIITFGDKNRIFLARCPNTCEGSIRKFKLIPQRFRCELCGCEEEEIDIRTDRELEQENIKDVVEQFARALENRLMKKYDEGKRGWNDPDILNDHIMHDNLTSSIRKLQDRLIVEQAEEFSCSDLTDERVDIISDQLLDVSANCLFLRRRVIMFGGNHSCRRKCEDI